MPARPRWTSTPPHGASRDRCSRSTMSYASSSTLPGDHSRSSPGATSEHEAWDVRLRCIRALRSPCDRATRFGRKTRRNQPVATVTTSPSGSGVLLRELSRERELLHLVAAFRKLHTAQIAEFLFLGSDTGVHSREVITRRILSGLRRSGLVACATRPIGRPGGGSAPGIYSLTEAGNRFLNRLDPAFNRPKVVAFDRLFVAHSLRTAD